MQVCDNKAATSTSHNRAPCWCDLRMYILAYHNWLDPLPHASQCWLLSPFAIFRRFNVPLLVSRHGTDGSTRNMTVDCTASVPLAFWPICGAKIQPHHFNTDSCNNINNDPQIGTNKCIRQITCTFSKIKTKPGWNLNDTRASFD